MQSSFESRLDSVDMDSHGLIKVLKDNLRQYPQDTVLRELVQNADDAEATFFGCLYIKPSHSKTLSPALGAAKLILINDGPVTEEQREKMFRLRAGWQIANESKIGKFGLGLKSIFHWCDFAWKMQLIQEENWQARFVDPVGAPNLPLERIRSREDDECVLSQVQSLVNKHFGTVKKDLFVLVLALRDDSTCTYLRDECQYQPISTIPLNFDKDIESEHLNISRLLPCLSNLETIMTIVGDMVLESSIETTTIFPNSFARLKRLETRMPMAFKSSGCITTTQNGVDVDSTPFAIFAAEVKSEQLSTIHNSDDWPVEWISDETGDHQVKEKAVQTGGVVLIGNGTSHVRLLHATYLPLRDVLLETDVDCPHGFDILIHGTFHVDSGRNAIVKQTATYDRIKIHWNTALFKHVVSPLIIPAIDSFLDEMVPQISSNIQDSIWELVRRYSVTSADYFTESGITDNAQLIYRASIDGVDKYYVDKNNSEIRYLPNCIRASSTHFNKFTMCLEESMFTSDFNKCLMNNTPAQLSNPLSLFGLEESTDVKTLAKLTRLFESDDFVEQDPNEDGVSIATVIRWHLKNGSFHKYEQTVDWAEKLCDVLVVREDFAPKVQVLLQDLSKCLESNEIITTINGNCDSDELKLLAVSARRLRPFLEAFESFEGQEKRIVGAALFLELSIEANMIGQIWHGANYRYLNSHSGYRIPLRYLQRGHVLFQGLNTVRDYFHNDRCSLDIAISNRLNLVRRLDADTEFEITGLSQMALEKLGFVGDCTQAKFIQYITEVDRFSKNKGIASHCVRTLLDCYHEANNRNTIDQCVLKVATWNSNLSWIAVERDLTSPTVTKLLMQLGHNTISAHVPLDIDSDLVDLLINHAITFPDNECVRLLTSSNLKLAIDEATPDQLEGLTFDHPEQDKNYLLNVARLGPETLRKLPIVISVFGKPVVPDQAKLGVFLLPGDLRIPIVSSNDSNLLSEFGVDYVVPDGILITDSDCVSADLLFDIIIKHAFTHRFWSESQKIRLNVLYSSLRCRQRFSAETAAKCLRQHVIPNQLNGTSVYLAGDCPEVLITALKDVFKVELFGDQNNIVIDDICSIDSELSQQLIPTLQPRVLDEEIWNENTLQTWIEYWQHYQVLISASQRQKLNKWVLSNKHVAMKLAFYEPLPIHKTWSGDFCSPQTNSFPVAKSDFSWLKHIPKHKDYFLTTPILSLDESSEEALFEYLCSDFDLLGETIGRYMLEFRSILSSKDLASFLANVPFIAVKNNYRTVHDILIPSAGHEDLDNHIALILNKETEVLDFVKDLPVFLGTRRDVSSRLADVFNEVRSKPSTYAIGTHPFTIEEIGIICASTDKPKHPTIRLIKTIIDCNALNISEKNNYVSETLIAAKGFSHEAMASLTYDLANARLEDNPTIQQFICGLITSEYRNNNIDFRVPAADFKWRSAKSTLLHGFNVPIENLLVPSYAHGIAANLASPIISDISEYFENDVWSDFQSLKSATLAMLGVSELSIDLAESGLPNGYKTKDLTLGFDRRKFSNFAFHVRNMNTKTRMQYCDGHFDEVKTSSDQLKSLVDHIDTTTNQTKVYLVLPTTDVDPNELRKLLLDLAPTIYRELGMDAEECKRRIQDLSDDGQTTITETQQIALSRFQTTLQMIGQSRMPTLLQELAEELTSQQLRVTKSQWTMLERHQKGAGIRLDEHEIDLIGQNKQTQDRLVILLESDLSIHKQSVEAIRDATTRYSYDKLSFAFELIQNADDALEQLKDLDEFPTGDIEVVVDVSTGAFILAHPGRRINYYQNKDRSIQKTKFKNDLVYMLTLNLTDKSDVDVSSKDERRFHQVTGKYGLGFKSVYHVTDDVKITSGELAAEFRCGIWPMRLDHESRNTLDAWRAKRGIPKSSTVIQLGGVTDVPRDFIDALVLLPLSTRNIRTIKYIDSEGKETTFTCKSQKLAEHINIIETTSKRTFLQVVGTDNYTWQCFEIVDGLPVRIKDISNYWVTVPTRAAHKPGFICNASFPLNSARTDVERNPFLFKPFFEMFTTVMEPAYMSLMTYLRKPTLHPSLTKVDTTQSKEIGKELRLALEDILKGDGPLFSFLNLKGLPSNQQEQAIESQAGFLTQAQQDELHRKNDEEADSSKPKTSDVVKLFRSLVVVDEGWHQQVDTTLYGSQMPRDWFMTIREFEYESENAREIWHRLILRSTFESVGVLRTASSCQSLLSAQYMRESIRLSRTRQGRSLLSDSTNYLNQLVWDDHNHINLETSFYSGEIIKAAILTSDLKDVVDHLEVSLRNFSIAQYQNPRTNGGRHLLRFAIGSKASFFLLREVLRCFSRTHNWDNNLDKASKYAFVVTDPLASALDISATDDVARAQSLNALIEVHCEDLPHKIGYDLQLRQKLRCL